MTEWGLASPPPPYFPQAARGVPKSPSATPALQTDFNPLVAWRYPHAKAPVI